MPEEKREIFIKMMGDPLSELTQQLLADNGKQFTPWWKGGEDHPVKRPSAMNIPGGMVERMPTEGPSLLYNICAVW